MKIPTQSGYGKATLLWPGPGHDTGRRHARELSETVLETHQRICWKMLFFCQQCRAIFQIWRSWKTSRLNGAARFPASFYRAVPAPVLLQRQSMLKLEDRNPIQAGLEQADYRTGACSGLYQRM